MRPLRYSINVTLDGCCDHREGIVDEDLHRNAAQNIAQADALLFGRVTYEMMEAAWRWPAGARPDWAAGWMEPFARTIDAAKKYVVSSTLDRVDWSAELVRGVLGSALARKAIGREVPPQRFGAVMTPRSNATRGCPLMRSCKLRPALACGSTDLLACPPRRSVRRHLHTLPS